MYIPAWLIILGFVGAWAALVSVLAGWRGIPLLAYWAIPVGATLPWVLVFIFVAVWAAFEKNPSRGQAMSMSALFPLFGVFAALFLGAVGGLFLYLSASLHERFWWSLGISGVPALCMAAFLTFVFLQK